tara:strand:- start:3972 stop:4541 length:570 start_codon:yes stop_codon:yes gene_type:complete
MKILATILFTLFSLTCFSQIKSNILDTQESQVLHLFNSINEYRESKGLNPLELDTCLVNACEMHCIYMSFYDCAGHYQPKQDSIHLMKNISFFRDRAVHYKAKIGPWLAENSCNLYFPHTQPWGNGIKYDLNNLTYVDYSFNVLGAWKWSKYHNETLLNPKGKTAGVYQYVYIGESGKPRVASTFLITN